MGRPAGAKNRAPAQGRKSRQKAPNGITETRTAPRKRAAADTAPSRERNQPSPEETAQFLSELTTLKTAARSIAGDISALGGRVKGRGGPAYWRSIKRQHDRAKMDPAEARADLEADVMVAAQMGIRISWMGDQATFADIMEQTPEPAPASFGAQSLAVARAHSDGFNSGRNGAVPHDNPFAHKPGSPEYVAWHNGRDEGALAKDGKNPVSAERIKQAETADATLPSDPPPEAATESSTESVF